MRKKYILLILPLILVLSSFGPIHLKNKKRLELRKPFTSKERRALRGRCSARDAIVLKPGFSQRGNMRFFVNPDMACPADYLATEINGESRKLNKGLSIGSLAGKADVSPTGAATYTIQIAVPAGTAGMQPQLAISYNSQQGRTVLGKGFNLTGLSAISRTNQNFYFDGKSSSLSLTENDRFTFDGQRLLKVGGTYGIENSEYRTEQNSFAKISFVKGSVGLYFKVETKDGKIFEYGNTADSRLKLGTKQHPLVYYLNKVTDNNGNYMTYKYITIGFNDICIKQIDYSGNQGLAPHSSVTFFYDKRDDQRSSYVLDYEILKRALLRNIKVKTNQKIVRKYDLKYFKNAVGESCLNEIVESNAANEKHNSTIFNWNEIDQNKLEKTFDQNFSSNTKRYYSEPQFADFNGDGLTDFIVVSKPKYNSDYWDKWYLFIAKKTGDSFIRKEGSVSGYKRLYISDVDNDGDMDLLWQRTKRITYKCNCESDEDEDGNIDPAEDKIEEEEHCQECSYSREYFYFYYYNGSTLVRGSEKFDFHNSNLGDKVILFSGDFNGNGEDDYLARDPNTDRTGFLKNIGCNYFYLGNPDKIEIRDFNGDGRVDIGTIKGKIVKIHSYNPLNNKVELICSKNIDYELGNSYFGDFNGDHKLDILFYSDNRWRVALFTGTDYLISYEDIPLKGLKAINGIKFLVQDLNNDGLDDIIETYPNWKNGSASDHILNRFYNRGLEFKKEASCVSICSSYYWGDFNGDGKKDLFTRSHYASPYKLYFFGKNKYGLLKSITDGYKNIIKFNYKFLTQGNFYSKSSNVANSSLLNLQIPLNVVVFVQTTNDLINYKHSYKYKNLVCNKGKGLLGFAEIQKTDGLTGFKTVVSNTINKEFFVVKEQSKKVYNGNELISTNTTRFKPETFSQNPKLIFNHPTTVSRTDGLTNITNTQSDFKYDTYGNLLSVKQKSGNDKTVITTNVFEKKGAWCKSRIVSSIVKTTYKTETPDVKTKTFTYDNNGNLSSSSSKGIKTTYSYDKFGNVIAQTVPTDDLVESKIYKTYDKTGRYVKSATNELGQINKFTYNELGLLQSKIGFDGLTTSYTYDTWGNLTKTT
ncbi:MAG: FG-GAP-like repeat-containing protein [Bacteroidales bacterium]|nr:FG-GAP-like repeat-containing protein [Bacteroidales bacterium]